MSDWTEFRDTAEAAAVIVGNYYFPGSSLITKHLVSDGAEEKLDSDTGRVLQLGSGGFGASNGNLANWTGGEGGSLPSFGEGSSPAPAKSFGFDWSTAPDESAAETTRLLNQNASATGTPIDNAPGIDWSGKAEKWAKEKAIEKGIEQAVGGNKQQQPVDDSSSTAEASDKAARRQALMEKAQRLRDQIAALRAQVVRESAIPQTVLGNPA
jgi:hypothetical protein